MRLPTLKSKNVISVLKRIGFERVRQSGSHVVLVNHNIIRKIVIVPVHANKDLKRGTLRNIIKQSGLTVKDFLKLL